MMIFRTSALAMVLCALIPASAIAAGAEESEAAEPSTQTAAPPATDPSTATPPDCLTQTGSHLKRDAEHPCINAAGQVITRDQIDRSGAATTAEALKRLSPAVR